MDKTSQDMIKKYEILKKGYDFMGYKVEHPNQLSFHHLIIPNRNCKELGWGNGRYEWNGSILVQNTSHNYLHVIETFDRDMFIAITKEMIEENRNGEINIKNLKAIREILLLFEKEYAGKTNVKGKEIIRDKFISKRIKL